MAAMVGLPGGRRPHQIIPGMESAHLCWKIGGIVDHRRISPCLVSVLCAGRHLRSSIKHRLSLDLQHDTTHCRALAAAPSLCSPEFDRQSKPGGGILEALAPLVAMHLFRIFHTHLFQTHCPVAP